MNNMIDVHTKEVRSYNMSRIRSKNTTPEIVVRHYLFNKGYRFKLHAKNLPGKPDIILPKYKTIIFVHGCFWHGHPDCRYAVIPKTRTEYWEEKINRNKQNDIRNSNCLREMGWDVITIYECELKKDSKEKTLRNIIEKLNSF